MLTATLLLPPRSRMLSLCDPSFAKWLARGDELTKAAPGRYAEIARVLQRRLVELPAAAWSRLVDCGDAANHTWWRADPCTMRADPNGLRLVQYAGFDLPEAALARLERALRPLFGDHGFEFSAPNPLRFYLRAHRESLAIELPRPDDIVGDDVYAHFPTGPDGRLWRRLINEAQVELHQLTFLDELAAASGGARLNSLWFWGGGALSTVRPPQFKALLCDDVLFTGYARQHELALLPRDPDAVCASHGRTLIECWMPEAQDWFAATLWPRLARLLARGRATLTLDFADGGGVRIAPGHRWRFWRRSRPEASAPA